MRAATPTSSTAGRSRFRDPRCLVRSWFSNGGTRAPTPSPQGSCPGLGSTTPARFCSTGGPTPCRALTTGSGCGRSPPPKWLPTLPTATRWRKVWLQWMAGDFFFLIGGHWNDAGCFLLQPANRYDNPLVAFANFAGLQSQIETMKRNALMIFWNGDAGNATLGQVRPVGCLEGGSAGVRYMLSGSRVSTCNCLSAPCHPSTSTRLSPPVSLASESVDARSLDSSGGQHFRSKGGTGTGAVRQRGARLLAGRPLRG